MEFPLGRVKFWLARLPVTAMGPGWKLTLVMSPESITPSLFWSISATGM